MHATIITTDDLSLASDMVFHPPNQKMQTYLNQNLQEYISDIGHVVPNFAQDLQNRYHDFLNNTAMYYVNNLKSRINGLWNTNTIRYLPTIESIQQAPPLMQKWIMAQPTLKERFIDRSISAYDGEYKEENVVGSGNKDYYYRRVVDNVVRLNEDKDVISQHFIETVNNEDILTVIEKCKILATWDVIENHFNENGLEDPTSPWNENL